MLFSSLPLIQPILRAVDKKGYTTPSPIQEAAIPIIVEGKNVLGRAETGTGKTAAFSLPIIQHLNEIGNKRHPSALILAPTRELVEQIKDSFLSYGSFTNLRVLAVYGGISDRPQKQKLAKGVDILVATPGRLLDLINQKSLMLKFITHFVIDEADRMFDMGFILDVTKIMNMLPKEKQTMMFSATLDREVMNLADEHIGDYEVIDVAKEKVELNHITQQLFYVSKRNKIQLLKDQIKNGPAVQTLIFTRTKHGADQLATILMDMKLKVAVIHGNKSQQQRLRALQGFKANRFEFLIATDVAARGLDIPALPRIINYDVPEQADAYIHRMGRTGRAGLTGDVYTYCSKEERLLLKPIFKELEAPLVSTSHAYEEIVEVKKQQTRPFAKKHGGYKNRLSGRKR
jgi:ATP-dependent RNA helicase RhlE